MPAHGGILAGRRWCPMDAVDRVIRCSTALAVLGVAAVVSYEHASALVRALGESGWTGRLIPLTVDGLDALAAGGLLYSNMHTTAPCSPSRSCIITGRNHHANATAAPTGRHVTAQRRL